MPHDKAWTEVENAARNGRWGNAFVGAFTDGQSPSAFETDQLEKQQRAAADAQTPNDALREMAEDVSEYLLAELPRHAERNGVTNRINVGMGEFINRDRDPALNQGLTLIREQLLMNDEFRRRFRLVSSSQASADAILREVQGSLEQTDPTGRGSGGSSAYDWRDLYVVVGNVWINRQNNNRELTVNINVIASHPHSREDFGAKTYSRTYVYHPGFQRFISKEQDDQLRATYDPSA
jgi:hypothetical protein